MGFYPGFISITAFDGLLRPYSSYNSFCLSEQHLYGVSRHVFNRASFLLSIRTGSGAALRAITHVLGFKRRRALSLGRAFPLCVFSMRRKHVTANATRICTLASGTFQKSTLKQMRCSYLGFVGRKSAQFARLYAPIHQRPDPFKGTENAT